MLKSKPFRIDWELRELGPRPQPVLTRSRAAKGQPKAPGTQTRARRSPARYA